jgi:hypothetical protein
MKSYLLDANLVNARQQNKLLNVIEEYAAQSKVCLQFTRPAYDEACYGSKTRSQKTDESTWVNIPRDTARYLAWFEKIERVVFPTGAFNQNQRNDIDHLVIAQQTKLPFVTTDGASKTQPGGILGAREKLRPFGITILKLEEMFQEIINENPLPAGGVLQE